MKQFADHPDLHDPAAKRHLTAAITQEKFEERQDTLRTFRNRLVSLICAGPQSLAYRIRRGYSLHEERNDEEAAYMLTKDQSDAENYKHSADQDNFLRIGTIVASACACLVELV